MNLIQRIINKLKGKPHLECIQARYGIIHGLKEIIDLDFQLKYWSGPDNAHHFWDHFSRIISFLMDDLYYKDDPEGHIGYSLFSHQEVEAIDGVISEIEIIIYMIGQNKKDEAYHQSPYWEDLIGLTVHAYRVLSLNNKKYQIDI